MHYNKTFFEWYDKDYNQINAIHKITQIWNTKVGTIEQVSSSLQKVSFNINEFVIAFSLKSIKPTTANRIPQTLTKIKSQNNYMNQLLHTISKQIE